MQDAHNFGLKLRALRQHRDLSTRELAEQLGYNAHGHIVTIELGQRMPSLDVVLRVSSFFGVSTDLLLRDSYSVEDVLAAIPAQ
ncbi:MAG TPA: helix-turn-helix transcriptional regulator [Roseiflexaceae bacterium]|nr:helix-turn-helix transcriptional regulator [Roseiflexaceae bacterium]